ncbi:uncharacterized protein DUF488 [Stackebrandtia endophytica]|uniref:Uncharacterized protein DUF488 n=1 Tax=Stackebrandtia endophytica TaxID=1496996 RepID=A0A543AQ77_9ACTN|nr:DUF488 domain-containing protein [Stackebrandtia endophytica]TQL74714.1 uncharacterized protein DUF488 [Stackebrandtia endophytica]
MAGAFFTVGHSDRSFEEFTALVSAAEVALIVDVRRFPGSRANPQFDKDALSSELPSRQIAYCHLTSLGGRRPADKDIAPDVNGQWRNQSFHNYADYALSPQFHAGLMLLREWGHRRPTAVMCSEAVWWRCHRRIIADHLMAHGEAVFHIMSGPRITPARLTPGAVVRNDGSVDYPILPTAPHGSPDDE